MSKSGLEIVDVAKSYGTKTALDGVSLELARGRALALLGPSGSGKSTLLNIIAGLEPPDRGDVRWEDRSILNVPVHQRAFGFMFQDYMLFPHMNVYDNVAFGMRMANRPAEEIAARVGAMLELVGLPGFEKRDVVRLSGGEQQRIALARALAPEPRLLLLDEPLGALDRLLRERLALELRDILQKLQQTAIYVTHDQGEAFVIAHHVVILNEGRIAQSGTAREIYTAPQSEFVARFLGLDNILRGNIQSDGVGKTLNTVLGRWPLPAKYDRPSGEVKVLLRPDAVSLNGSADCQLQGVITERNFRGSLLWVKVRTGDLELTFDFPGYEQVPAEGESVQLCFDPEKALHILSA